jgi:Flp pilus assembly protein TadD
MAAQLLLKQGKTAEAEERLRAVVQASPANAEARNDLAWLLASRGADLDTALSLAEQARRIRPTVDVIDTLGFVQLKRGDAAVAVSLFEEALALRPKDPTIRYHLGLALAQAGNRERAAATLQEALDSGPFPEAEAARLEMARLQQPQG